MHFLGSLANWVLIGPVFQGLGKPEQFLANGDELVTLFGSYISVRIVISAHAALGDLRKVDAFLLWVAALS